MSFSNYLEAALLDHLFDLAAYTAPSIYVALSTADPGEDGSTIAEPVGGSYARVLVAAWSRSVSEVDNDAEVAFAEATGDWGTITHFALFDAITAGNFLGSAALGASQAVNTGSTARFPAGDLNITLD